MTSKTVLSKVEGFTPLIDILIKQYNGIVTAAVFGRVWRYCQGTYGECSASLQTIADELGISYATTLRHIKTLCADGYLEDGTPDLRNRPHTYADTGKVGLQVLLRAGLSESKSTLSESESTLSESKGHSIREQDEDTIRNKERDKRRRTTPIPEKTEPKTEPPDPDYLDLVLATKARQDKHKLPITYLSETVAELLGLSKVPNHKFDELWESPLSDLLDQADGDIERVEAALRAAVLEGRDGGITMTTPNSLHGLALQKLADRDNGQDVAKIAKEAAAQATMLRLAKEHGHL